MATPITLEILIPTFNRSKDLKRNLKLLDKYIGQESGGDVVKIIVSDNCSSDDTEAVVHGLQLNLEAEITYHRNDENIGLEKNVVKTLSLSRASYVMFVGDDDFIDQGYLGYCLDSIRTLKVGAIIPGLKNLLADGSISSGRIEVFDQKSLVAGYSSAYFASHLGHQMSGLVLKRKGLLDHYLKYEQWRNPYLFIHFLTYCLLRYDGMYVPVFKTGITTFNEKDWGYNTVGLLDEVFKSYYAFADELSDQEICDLIIRFSTMHSYRYGLRISKPLKAIRQFCYLSEVMPKITGLRRKLALQIFKDYLLSLNETFK